MFRQPKALSFYESVFKDYPAPHCKYVIKPIYQFLGGHKNPLISVPLTFALTDMLFHQWLAALLYSLYTRQPLKEFTKLNPYQLLFWTILGLPVAYYKHQKNRQQSVHQDEPVARLAR